MERGPGAPPDGGDVETMGAGLLGPRHEGQVRRVELIARDLGGADGGQRANYREVLRLQAGFAPADPDVREGHRPAKGDSETQGHAEDLTSALPVGGVERDHGAARSSWPRHDAYRYRDSMRSR
jgi:hypothetical protein